MKYETFDPWDPILSITKEGAHRLSSVEFTVTNLCNMRCEHCAVGDSLTLTEGARLPLEQLIHRLDEVERLTTISITGGEPSFHERTVKEYIVPLLKYAHDRGVRTQLNSNLTLDRSRYEMMAPYLDVMHISFNYTEPEDFYSVGFVQSSREVSRGTAYKMYEQMIDNCIELSRSGMFVSAETMINYRTLPKLERIHELVAEMGCRRHEVHPMYPSSFAEGLPMLTQDQMRSAVKRLLQSRRENIWMLFGTLPFFRCSSMEDDQELLRLLAEAPNVTVRNDPDGRNRLNVNCFTGDVFVTDFANVPPLGSVQKDRLEDVFERWRQHPLNRTISCYCPEAGCCGPNLLVADMYYQGVDFQTRKAMV